MADSIALSRGGALTSGIRLLPQLPHSSTPAFRWSWRLFTLAGIDVYVHASFLLLLAVMTTSDLMAGSGVSAMATGMLLTLSVFTFVVLHEFGHALTARRYGISTLDITLLPIGGVARLQRMPEHPLQQLVVALAGPAVNVGAAAILLMVLAVLPVLGVQPSTAGDEFLTRLIWINLSLAAFNLLPGYPLDGGRVLRAALAMRMAPEAATRKAARVGQAVSIMLGVSGYWLGPMVMVVAAVLWLSAQAEHAASMVREALEGVPVRRGMIRDFSSLAPTDPLLKAVALARAGFQQDFPVLECGKLVGVLSHSDMCRGLTGWGATLPVQQAMSRDFDTATPAEPLDSALRRMQQHQRSVIMVVEDDKLIGILSVGNLSEYLAVHAAGRLAPELRADLAAGRGSVVQ